MKPLPFIGAGGALFILGAVVRHCETGAAGLVPFEWCGPATQAISATHAHCAGCGLMELGALSLVLGAAASALNRMRRTGHRVTM